MSVPLSPAGANILPPPLGWWWPRPRGPYLSSQPPEELPRPPHKPVYLQSTWDYMNTGERSPYYTVRTQFHYDQCTRLRSVYRTNKGKVRPQCSHRLNVLWLGYERRNRLVLYTTHNIVNHTVLLKYLLLWLGWFCSSPEVQSQATRCPLGLSTAPARQTACLVNCWYINKM